MLLSLWILWINCPFHEFMKQIHEKGIHNRECLPLLNWQLPILPARLQASTFGVYVLNCCVRYGNRWYHIALVTRSSLLNEPRPLKTIQKTFLVQTFQAPWFSDTLSLRFRFARSKRLALLSASLRSFFPSSLLKLSPRLISTGPLHALRHFHSQPICLVFFKVSYQPAL